MFRRSSSSSVESPQGPGVGSSARVGDYTPLFDLVAPQRSALSVSTVYRCVSLLSHSVANLPMQYLRLKDGLFVADTTSRLHYLLSVQPEPTKSAFDFWRDVVSSLLLDGNAYIVPLYHPSTMELDRLVLCGRGTVQHDIYRDTYTVTDLVNGLSGVYDESEILHLKCHSVNGKEGVSVLSYARLTLGIAVAGDTETRNRFVNGGNVHGILTNDKSVTFGVGEYQDSELEKTAAMVDRRLNGGSRIVSLPGQVDFKQLSLSSTDMQFLESRKFTVREICRFFGVHPSFVFDDTSNNYKSAEMANVAFLSNTLNPILRQIECELLRKLVPASLSGKRRFSFDRRGLYACDLASLSKYQSDTIAMGLYTVNEWRREENKPAVEGGDTVLVSANLRGISDPVSAPPSSPSPVPHENLEEDGKEE